MATIRFEGVQKTYPNGHVAARGLNLAVADGEFVVLVGPSGCGKSTALRMLAGLETPTAGRIFIGDHDVTAVPPQERDVAMVFQSYALYPHMTVRANMGFGLRMRGAPPDRIAARVAEVAQALGLEMVLDRKPGQLSGGQRQRVALGRAIAREPQVFLFDEPLSNLDAKLRVAMRTEIKELHQRLKTTTVYVTHDQIEAMTMADKIVVMHDGRVEQAGPPLELYDRPANRFVGGFIGSPAMNFLPARIEGERVSFSAGVGFTLPLPTRLETGREVVLGIRPEHLEVAADGFDAEVVVIEPTGSETQLFARVGEHEITAVFRERHAFAPGQRIRLRPQAHVAHVFDSSSGERL